ncbi:hypothetical protein LDENG_00023250, partial [Lucifuga dentata]
AGRHIIISQLADDTTLFLKDEFQIPKSNEYIKSFSAASGLNLNITKCELLPIKSCEPHILYKIPVKSQIKYLGIVITKDATIRCDLNFKPITEKTQKWFNMWLMRDLTLKGRTLLTKAEGINRLVYAALSLYVDTSVSKEIDRLLFSFLWKNKNIKDSVIMNSIENGGLNVLDFASLNYTFKINWIRQFLSNPNSIWNFIPNYIFS